MLLFLVAVALGLPLLSGGRGGLGVFMAPAAGYLIGWPFGALLTGWTMTMLPSTTPKSAAISAFFAACLGGLLVHAMGVAGLVRVANLSWTQAFFGTLVFVPGDLLKCAVSAMVVHTVARGLPDWNFGSRALK
jgi:biotin transport system substrate-specific component